jgi:cell division protein FtsI (penicillin-binding protein 3)
MKQNNKSHILFRYALITIMFLMISVAIVVKLFLTTVVEADAWNERAKKELSKLDTISPERGNILADNGNILACNVKVCDINFDMRHSKVIAQNPIPWAKIDSLADSLDYYYPKIINLSTAPADTFKKYSWHTRLKREFEKDISDRPRRLMFVRNGSLSDYDRIRSFPYFKDFKGNGQRNPLYTEKKDRRIYPYGKMAVFSIGRVSQSLENPEIHGYAGLERDLDSLLYGKEGYAKKVALTNGFSNWTEVPAKRGYDIVTTIDIDLQELLEEELLAICKESNAKWATAILMEVATGEIKAMSNIDHLDDGTFTEARNRAVEAVEPGSVMKPISMMIAFEDGLVKSVNDVVDCSPFQRTSDPHAPSVKTMKQVIEMSSNTGISRIIFRGYAQDPSKFYDRLASIGFFEPMHSGIAEERPPRIRKLLPTDKNGNNITMTARHLDLARQAYGYNTEIPPLYTLSIYNAIANNGRYVRPHLVRALRDADGNDSIIPISYIRNHICSAETAEKVRQCMHEVVWGEHGTARAVRDDRVKIAGKTGTAYPVGKGGYDRSMRRYAFAGFFPYENPKYSCMALVLASSGTSANRTSGQVVKNVATKMFARGLLNNKSTYTAEHIESTPKLYATTQSNIKTVTDRLGLKKVKTFRNNAKNGTHKGVPDVKGLDIASAITTLERLGLNVRIHGSGMVVNQSIAPGSPINPGQTITLKLKS